MFSGLSKLAVSGDFSVDSRHFEAKSISGKSDVFGTALNTLLKSKMTDHSHVKMTPIVKHQNDMVLITSFELAAVCE